MPPDDPRTALLAAPPRCPTDPDLFSSNPLFGEPGIYPEGSPMVPAAGPATSEADARRALEAVGIPDAAARLADPALRDRAPEPGPRAGLVALSATVGAPLLDAFVAGATAVAHLGRGETASPGRVVGPPDATAADRPGGTRVVNDRYRAEHPALLAGSLAHDLLWSGPAAGQYEEATLHALCAFVHVQLLARAPFLARLGTELARRQNSLAVTLLNSRHPGRADLAVRAPRRARHHPRRRAGHADPRLLEHPLRGRPSRDRSRARAARAVLRGITGSEPPVPLRYDDALGTWWSARGVRGALSLAEQATAAGALGLIDVPGAAG